MNNAKLLAVVLVACSVVAQQSADTAMQSKPAHRHAATGSGLAGKNAFTPDEVQYGPPPPFIPAGAELAVLEGNPMATTGDYTIRLKMPDGYKIAPHWHPKRENVTVVAGTLKVGMGNTFDENKMMSFPTGSFAYLDPSMHHYAMASGDTIVQIHGAAHMPVKFNYVNPQDDPSKKQ